MSKINSQEMFIQKIAGLAHFFKANDFFYHAQMREKETCKLSRGISL